MGSSVEPRRVVCRAREKSRGFRKIGSEPDRLPSAAFLIHFGNRLNTPRPAPWSIERDALDHGAAESGADVADRFVACHHVKGINEVTDHLRR